MLRSRPCFSTKVLERKRALRRKRWVRFYSSAIFLLLNGIFFASLYSGHQEHLRTLSGPDWFAGTFSGDQWSVRATHEDGTPYVLKINGETWLLSKVNSLSDKSAAAETICSAQMIAYLPVADPMVLRTNLWHEVFHAGACVHGGDGWWNSINPTNKEHVGIYHLGDFTSSFIRDNPTFVDWAEE